MLRIAGFSGIALGLAVLVVGVVVVSLSHAAFRLEFFLWDGPFLIIQGCVQTIWVPRVQRRKASVALEVNRPAAAARLSFRAGDHQDEGGACDSGDGSDW